MSDAELQAVADRQAITEQIYRYCRAVDRLDLELGYAVWHEDGEADYGKDFYRGSGRGVIDLICAQHRRCLGHSHQISNVIIELNGDLAASESYVTATLRVRDGDKTRQLVIWARYVDTWSRRGGRWAIDKRVLVRDFDEARIVTPMSEPDTTRRDPSDPSYAIFRKAG